MAGLVVRLVLAGSLGLGVDESYMVAAGRVFRLGYFDHPPLSWWLSAGIARLAGYEAAWLVRLPFIGLFALSTWLMFRLGAALFGERAGLWAAVALNLAPVFSARRRRLGAAGRPARFFSPGRRAVPSQVRALGDGGAAWGWWVAGGVAAGGALLSKYSARMLVLGRGRAVSGDAAGPSRVACGGGPAIRRGGIGAGGVRAGADVERRTRLGLVRVPGRAPPGRSGFSRSVR